MNQVYFKVCADEIRTHKKVCPNFGHTSKFSFLGVFMSNNGGNLTIQYNLRWSEELKNKIAESAKAHNRSMNADIVARLEKSFEMEIKETSDDIISIIKEENAKLQESLAGILNGLTILKKPKADE